MQRDVIPSPLLYLSSYFEETREEYYARLLGVTERGEWEEWLEYFMRGVALQAQDAVDRIQRLDDLLSGWRQRLSAGQSRTAERALDVLAENPFCTVRGLAGRLDVAFTTAQRALDRLEGAGMVSHCSEKPGAIAYIARGPSSKRWKSPFNPRTRS